MGAGGAQFSLFKPGTRRAGRAHGGSCSAQVMNGCGSQDPVAARTGQVDGPGKVVRANDSDQQSAEEFQKRMRMVPHGYSSRGALVDGNVGVPTRLNGLSRHHGCDHGRTHYPYAKQHRRSLIHRRVHFVVRGLRKVGLRNRRHADEGRQQKQNECPNAPPHRVPLLVQTIARQGSVVNEYDGCQLWLPVRCSGWGPHKVWGAPGSSREPAKTFARSRLFPL